MQIIGWDDNKEYSYCADDNRHTTDISSCKNKVIGKGVWILKNSWGNLTPYLYLTYDSLDSTIGFINEIKTNKEKTWDNNYVLANTSTAYKEKSYVLKDLEKIKKSKKIVNFNYVKDNIDYSWIINGKKLNKLEDLDTTINFDTDNKKKILTLSNYADGIFVNLKQNNSNIKGITLKVYVGNKYEKDDSINIYSYNNDKLSVLLKKIKKT